MSVQSLENTAKRCRRSIVDMIHKAGAGHPGGSLSAIDLLVALYGTQMKVDPSNPESPTRDRFIMSKGHASPAVYAILKELGFLEQSDLDGFRSLGSVCQGHVDMKWTDGVDFSAGSLGMGLSFGIGTAFAAKMDGLDYQTWVMLGDGETQEGQIWEAFMAASYHNLENLHVIIDRNRIQNDDFVNVQMEIGDIAAKVESFGWNVKEIDGHDMSHIVEALQWSIGTAGPCAIIAHTIKGKGVKAFEHDPKWHARRIKGEDGKYYYKEFNKIIERSTG